MRDSELEEMNPSNNSNNSNKLPWLLIVGLSQYGPILQGGGPYVPKIMERIPAYIIPEAEARELWELKKWNAPREQLQNSRGHVIDLKEENQRLRQALEVYADSINWIAKDGCLVMWQGLNEEMEYEKEPWLPAKKALG